MGDFEIIEADFQQFYKLDVRSLKFQRYARLLTNLPAESRFFRKQIESKDWDWDKEVQSRILLMLDTISCQLANMTKKKGAKPAKPGEQFQPDYVKEAKKKFKLQKRENNREELDDLKSIFEKKNNNAKTIGETI